MNLSQQQKRAIATARELLLQTRAVREEPNITIGRLDTILVRLLRELGEENLPLLHERPRLREPSDDDEEPEPATRYCPICEGRLDADGKHVTRSGAKITPEIVVPAGALVTPHVVGAL